MLNKTNKHLLFIVFLFCFFQNARAAVTLIPDPVYCARDANGNPLAGGKLYTYAASTTTPLASYTDSTGGTPNTNPVILDSTGCASVWLGNSAYKFNLLDTNSVQQTNYPVNNVTRYSSYAELNNFQVLTSISGTNTIAATAPTAFSSYATGQTFRFQAANTNTATVTININGIGAKSVVFPGSTTLYAGYIVTNNWYEIVYDGTRFVLLNNRPFITPEECGAKGGSNDDTTPFQSCLNIAAAYGIPFNLTSPTYTLGTMGKISVSLSSGQSLIINGNNSVITSNYIDTGTFYSDNVLGITGTSSGSNHVVINDLILKDSYVVNPSCVSNCPVRGSTIGLALNTLANVRLNHVSITGFTFQNTWIYYVDGGSSDNSNMSSSAYAGLFMQSTQDFIIHGGTYNLNGGYDGIMEGYGITAATKHNSGDRDNARITIEDVTAIDNVGKCFDAHDALEFRVHGGICRGFFYNGVFAVNQGSPSQNVSDVEVTGVYIDGTSSAYTTTTNMYGIQVGTTGNPATYTGSVTVSDNTILNIQSNPAIASYGIDIENAASGSINVINAVIHGNTLVDACNTLGSVIRTSSGGVSIPNVDISHNTIYSNNNFVAGIIEGQVSNTNIDGNIISTAGGVTATYGISPYSGATAKIIGNILAGATWGTTFNVNPVSAQIYEGNMVNGSIFNDIINTGVLRASGTGSPESSLTAPVGSIYQRLNGGANTSLYVKESGSGNTGWIGK